MPCYHFIFHGYGTWMPDKDEGNVRRGQGQQPQDLVQAKVYRSRMLGQEVSFDEALQRLIIEEVLVAATKQSFRTHFVATEPTHVHILVSWSDERPWQKLRNGIKSSLTRRLKTEVACKEWLSESGSRRRVKNDEHFENLVYTYLARHSGLKWSERLGIHKDGGADSGGC